MISRHYHQIVSLGALPYPTQDRRRRLAALETSLTPTGRVLAWLEEVHAFRSLDAYVDSLLDQPPEAFLINRLANGAAESARKEAGRAPAEVVDAAVRTVLRGTIFRFELVLRINVVAHEMIDKEVLVHAALAGQLAVLATDDRTERLNDPVYLRRLAQCRDLALMRVEELMADEEARSRAEGRYLDGHPALFPASVDKWAEQLHLSQELAVMADRTAELDGVAPAPATDPDMFARRAAVLASDLLERARSTALEKLDEGRLAHRIATGWLRSKLQSAPPPSDPETSPVTTTR